jgi:hypothetical protein
VRWSSSSEGAAVSLTLIPSTWLPPAFVFKILTKWLLGRTYATCARFMRSTSAAHQWGFFHRSRRIARFG